MQEQVSQSGNAADQQGTGIILRRKKRDDSSPSKVGDPLVIADMVQRLCQVTGSPLWTEGMHVDCGVVRCRFEGVQFLHGSSGLI